MALNHSAKRSECHSVITRAWEAVTVPLTTSKTLTEASRPIKSPRNNHGDRQLQVLGSGEEPGRFGRRAGRRRPGGAEPAGPLPLGPSANAVPPRRTGAPHQRFRRDGGLLHGTGPAPARDASVSFSSSWFPIRAEEDERHSTTSGSVWN